MPRLSNSLPKYRRHRPSGQAVVTLSGRDFYLGPYGTKTSKLEYDRLIGQWLANGRRMPTPNDSPPENTGVTVVELISAYWTHAKGYYRKNGRATTEVGLVKRTCRHLKETYGRLNADGFTPMALKELRGRWISEGLTRSTINGNTRRVVRMFRWGVSEGLVNVTTYQALATLPGLHKGRSAAKESTPVAPVADEVVNLTLEHLGPIMSAMVRFQLLTGCRPDEVCQVRPSDVERSGDVWIYTPSIHKTEHRGQSRAIHIGPKAQVVLAPFLLRSPKSFCFNPAESEEQRRRAKHLARKTPLSCGNVPGTKPEAVAPL